MKTIKITFLTIIFFITAFSQPLDMSMPIISINVKYGQKIELPIILKNVSDSSVVIYNFLNRWNEIIDESIEPSKYIPGFHGNWDPGINVICYNQKDTTGSWSVGQRGSRDYTNPEMIDTIFQRTKQKVLRSRRVMLPGDSLSTSLIIHTKVFLPNGQYYLYVYYEMNKEILKYVPWEKNIFFGRIKSAKVVVEVE